MIDRGRSSAIVFAKKETGLLPAQRPVSPALTRCLVDGVLEALAGLEFRLLGRGDLDLLAGPGIATFRGRPRRHGEGPEPDQAYLVAVLERGRDRIEHGVDGRGRVGFLQVCG